VKCAIEFIYPGCLTKGWILLVKAFQFQDSKPLKITSKRTFRLNMND